MTKERAVERLGVHDKIIAVDVIKAVLGGEKLADDWHVNAGHLKYVFNLFQKLPKYQPSLESNTCFWVLMADIPPQGDLTFEYIEFDRATDCPKPRLGDSGNIRVMLSPAVVCKIVDQ